LAKETPIFPPSQFVVGDDAIDEIAARFERRQAGFHDGSVHFDVCGGDEFANRGGCIGDRFKAFVEAQVAAGRHGALRRGRIRNPSQIRGPAPWGLAIASVPCGEFVTGSHKAFWRPAYLAFDVDRPEARTLSFSLRTLSLSKRAVDSPFAPRCKNKRITRRFLMKILSASFMALNFCAASAVAADLPSVKRPPPSPPPIFTWTGVYIGLNTGYLLKGNDNLSATTTNLFDLSRTGIGPASALGASGVAGGRLDGLASGVQIGGNWQFADKFVAGVEADFQGGGVQGGGSFGSVTPVPPALIPGLTSAATEVNMSRRLEWFGTARGRLGYAVTPTLLAYATGGLAYGRVSMSASFKQTLAPGLLVSTDGDADYAGMRVGWTVGGGLEWAFYPDVSAKIEYLYYDLGVASANNDISLLTHSYPTAIPLIGGSMQVANAPIASTRFNGHIVRLGVNYHPDFGLPASTTAIVRAPAPAPNDWQFRFAPYGWSIGLNGNMTQLGRTVDVNSSFYDVLTKANHLLAWMSYLEARNGPFSFYGDIVWARLGFFGGDLRQTNPVGIAALTIDANASLKSTLGIGETWMGYEFARWRQGGGDAFTAIDAYGGLRYWYLSNTLSLDVTGVVNAPLLGFQQSGALAPDKSGAMQWIDPVLGLRLRHQIRPGDEFQLRGDIGGFGVGSKFSWQLAGGYSHDTKIGDWTITNTVGYRALAVDYSNGTAISQRGVNQVIHGPVMETSFRF
jgi:opacity protein-like surface antigen